MSYNHTRRRIIVAGGTAALALATPTAVIGDEHAYTNAEELAPPPELFGPEWVVDEEGPSDEVDDDNETEEEDTADVENNSNESDNGFNFEEDDSDDELDVDVQEEYTRTFESDEGYARVDTIVYDEDDNLEGALDNLTNEFLVTAEPLDIGDEAFYDEVDIFATVVFRDRNAIAVLMASQIIGFSASPARTTAIEGANTLIEYWHEEIL